MGLWGCRSPRRRDGGGLGQNALDGGVPGAGSAWNLARRARRRLGRAGRGSAGSKGCLRERSPRRGDLSGYLYRWALRSPLEPPWLGYRVPLAPSYSAGFRFVEVCALRCGLEGRTAAGPWRGARPGGSGGRRRGSAERQVAPGAGRGRADPARRPSAGRFAKATEPRAESPRECEAGPPPAATHPWSSTSSCSATYTLPNVDAARQPLATGIQHRPALSSEAVASAPESEAPNLPTNTNTNTNTNTKPWHRPSPPSPRPPPRTAPEMGAGSCCWEFTLGQLRACSWGVVAGSLRLPLASASGRGRPRSGRAGRRRARRRVRGELGPPLLGVGWVVLAKEALVPRGASANSPHAR